MDPKQDTFNESVSSILERKVRGWLSSVIEDMRRSSPVQQWLDSLPPDDESENDPSTAQNNISNSVEELRDTGTKSDDNKAEDTVTENTVVETNIDIPRDDKSLEIMDDEELSKRKSLESGMLSSISPAKNNKLKLKRDLSVHSEGYPPRFKNPLIRDHSLQSDGSGSSGSSVLNVLGARKVDAESVLLSLGFGPSEKQQQLQRIPDRFLTPSKLKGISTEQFIQHEQRSMRMHDCGIFGYRGLTGNPHVPPSTIVAKIMERIIQDDVFREEASIKARHSFADMRSTAAHQTKIPSRLKST